MRRKPERDPRKLAAQLRLYADHLRPGRSPDDLLYELILKSGLPLTAELEKVDVAGAAAYSIEGDALLLCLEEPVTEEILDAMVAREPRRIVCLDRAFQGNDPLKTNAVLSMRSRGIEFHTV